MSDVRRVVLDASAILALLFREPGMEAVSAVLPDAIASTVNLVEVLTKLADRGVLSKMAEQIVSGLDLDVKPFTAANARAAGSMRNVTRQYGLSLADRGCLALAAELGLPAVTADRSWASIATLVGVDVRLIRRNPARVYSDG